MVVIDDDGDCANGDNNDIDDVMIDLRDNACTQ